MISITTLFDDFFRYQPIAWDKICKSFRKYKINDFVNVCTVLCVYLAFDPIDEPVSIRFEFVKAMAYKICSINGTLKTQNS